MDYKTVNYTLLTIHPCTPAPLHPCIVCLSHLGWDSIWQRPHHILSRLARRYPVIYVNEPELSRSPAGIPYLSLVAGSDNLSAWQPFFPDNQYVMENWRNLYIDLVQKLLLQRGWIRQQDTELVAARPLILWFYTPSPYYCLGRIPGHLVVYDVMDQLSNFKGAARDLSERETRLLDRADVVFTGGRSLYQARKDRHPNTHLFASGVEPDHFALALDPATKVATEIASLPRPILGYYGAIDERIDLELLHILASDHPEWSIVMVGPVTKIEPTDLPRLPNILYPGKQPYGRLPNFLKGFDVCLMPFAMNEATRFISPTKSLEYMAAHKPIVSTPVPDVVANWSDVAAIAAAPNEFAAAIERVLNETRRQRRQRIARIQSHLACHSWDHIAAQMQAIIDTALTNRHGQIQ